VSEPWVDDALAAARVARLATAGEGGRLHLVPICFAVVSGLVVSAVDHKPKRTTRLERLRDIAATGRATVLIDHYDDEDWSRLWWIRIIGRADVHERGSTLDTVARQHLADKYRQYVDRPPAGPVYSIALDEVVSWRGGQAAAGTAGAVGRTDLS
jgi:PPOX class probable F420-dependent enzyme